jgi:hypothetical protein
MTRKRRRRGLGDVAITKVGHVRAMKAELKEVARSVDEGRTEAARHHLQRADYELDQVQWHDKTGIKGLADGCRDEHGFVPVPACMGRHVPGRSSGGHKARKGCEYGVNKRTGKCLKHPRRK